MGYPRPIRLSAAVASALLVAWALSARADWTTPGTSLFFSASEWRGRSATSGDFNGDGFDDFAVGLPSYTGSGPTGAGAVLVVYGATGTPGAPQLWHKDSPFVATSREAGEQFGHAVASGDFNGDGYDDLSIGVPRDFISTVSASAGAVHVLYGSPAGIDPAYNPPGDLDGRDQWLVEGSPLGGVPEANDEFGYALAAGQFNDDVYWDLAIGVPGEDSDEGKIFIVYGDLERLGQGSAPADQQLSQDSFGEPDFGEPGDRFGAALAAGDFGGDGRRRSVAVGVPGETLDGVSQAGAVQVFHANSLFFPAATSGLRHRGEVDMPGDPGSGDQFGATLAVGNLIGDAAEDLIVGVPNDAIGAAPDAGSITIIPGSLVGAGGTPPQPAGSVLIEQSDIPSAPPGLVGDSFLGLSLAAGDFDADGDDDLAAGATGADSLSGAVPNAGGFAVLESEAGTLDLANSVWVDHEALGGLAQLSDFGFATAAGDFNGDGQDDLLVTIPSEEAFYILLRRPLGCGDGQLAGGEQCDDGNPFDEDGCSSQCVTEFCGDTVVQAGMGESCDDGNTVSEDGCSDLCALEFCGDGTIQIGLGEQCDDSNAMSEDGCSDVCLLEFCGDGVAQAGLGEVCDDGNVVSFDGCNGSCSAVEVVTPIEVVGTGGGGTLEYTLAGATVSITIGAGDSDAQIAAALAAAINADPTLSGLGIGAASAGSRVTHTGGEPNSVDGTETGVALSTELPSLLGSVSLIPRTLDFDSLLPGGAVPDTSTLEGITFGYALDGETALATDAFETESPLNSLGLSGGDDAFLDGDPLSFDLPRPVLALGIYVVTSDPAEAGEIRLTTPQGSSSISGAPVATTSDGGHVYFLAHVATQPFTQATLDFASDEGVHFVYTVDDLSAAVPHEDGCGFVGTAVGGFTTGATVDGIPVQIATYAGQTAEQVAQALADAINADGALRALGTAAAAQGDQLFTNGTITQQLNTDPGLGGATAVPALGRWGLVLACSCLALGGLTMRARRQHAG